MYQLFRVGDKVIVKAPNGTQMEVTETDADYRLPDSTIADARKLFYAPASALSNRTERAARRMNFSAYEMFSTSSVMQSLATIHQQLGSANSEISRLPGGGFGSKASKSVEKAAAMVLAALDELRKMD
jgi:hypothetical protein